MHIHVDNDTSLHFRAQKGERMKGNGREGEIVLRWEGVRMRVVKSACFHSVMQAAMPFAVKILLKLQCHKYSLSLSA